MTAALRLALPVALIAACLWLADARAVLARLADASPLWMAVAVAAVAAQTALSAVRWRRVGAALGVEIAPGAAVREYFLAQFVNQTLPGGVAGDAARAVRSRGPAGLARAALAVVVERAAGQAGLLAITLAGAAAILATPGGLGGDSLGAAPPLLGLLAALTLAVPLALRLSRRSDIAAAAARAFRPGRPLAVQAALSLGTAALNLAAFAAAARATGTVLPLGAVATLVPLVLAAMLIPAAIGGWGWREGAAAALLPLAGPSAEAALAASLAFGLAVLAASLPGALFLARRGISPPDDAARVAAPPEPPTLSPRRRPT